MRPKKIRGIRFQPWIGANYYDAGSQRIFLLGESHYTHDLVDFGSENETTLVVKNFIGGERMKTPFFRNVCALLRDEDTMQGIAYANLIQKAMHTSKSQPDQEDIDTVKAAFYLLLKALQPDKTLVLSSRMWNYWLPEEHCTKLTTLKANEKSSEVWQYDIGPKPSLAMGINHPSSRGFSAKQWSPLVQKFLKL